MLPYSVLNLKDIVVVCQEYGIQKPKSFSLLTGGSENTNYLIATSEEKFVLTICEQKTEQSARELAFLLEHLKANEFKTSKLIRTKNNAPISRWKGKPVMLKMYLEGSITKTLPAHILETIGVHMGRLHQIKAPDYLPKELNYGIASFDEVEHYAAGSPFSLWLNEIQNYVQPFLSENLPKSLIHSDIFYSNVVVSVDGKSASIMDFEEAAYYYRIFDLGMTLVGLGCEAQTLHLGKAKALLKGYQKEIVLSALEKCSLQAFTVYAAAAMTFWRHRNFNHINRNPKMLDHYLELKFVADNVMHMPTQDFAEILN